MWFGLRRPGILLKISNLQNRTMIFRIGIDNIRFCSWKTHDSAAYIHFKNITKIARQYRKIEKVEDEPMLFLPCSPNRVYVKLAKEGKNCNDCIRGNLMSRLEKRSSFITNVHLSGCGQMQCVCGDDPTICALV